VAELLELVGLNAAYVRRGANRKRWQESRDKQGRGLQNAQLSQF